MKKLKRIPHRWLYLIPVSILIVGIVIFILMYNREVKDNVAHTEEYYLGKIRSINVEETKNIYIMYDELLTRNGIRPVANIDNTYDLLAEDGNIYRMSIFNKNDPSQSIKATYPILRNSPIYAIEGYQVCMGFVLEPGTYELKITLTTSHEPGKFITCYYDFESIIIQYLQSYMVLGCAIIEAVVSLIIIISINVAPAIRHRQPRRINQRRTTVKPLKEPSSEIKLESHFRFWAPVIIFVVGFFIFIVIFSMGVLTYSMATYTPFETGMDITIKAEQPKTIFFMVDEEQVANVYISQYERNSYYIKLNNGAVLNLKIDQPEDARGSTEAVQLQSGLKIKGKYAVMGIAFDKGQYNIKMVNQTYGDESKVYVTEYNFLILGKLISIGAIVLIASIIIALCSVIFIIFHQTGNKSKDDPNYMSTFREVMANRSRL